MTSVDEKDFSVDRASEPASRLFHLRSDGRLGETLSTCLCRRKHVIKLDDFEMCSSRQCADRVVVEYNAYRKSISGCEVAKSRPDLLHSFLHIFTTIA